MLVKPGAQILLVAKVLICRHEDLERGRFGGLQEFTVAQRRPSQFEARRYLMRRHGMPQGRGNALIEQDPHSRLGERTPGGVLEHRSRLLDFDAGKPFHELLDRRPVLEVLEQLCDRHPSCRATPAFMAIS